MAKSDVDKQEIVETLILPTLTSILNLKKKSPSLEMPLFGTNGQLDSLSFVSFIIEVEMRFEERYQVPIQLISPLTLSRTQSPFETIEKLADFILEVVQEKK